MDRFRPACIRLNFFHFARMLLGPPTVPVEPAKRRRDGIISEMSRGSGEIGRRARLRGVWSNPCRFKSCLPHRCLSKAVGFAEGL